MCGINGILLGATSIDNCRLIDSISSMNEQLSHRGPDDSGYWLSENGLVALGHTRLSILDLSSAGHQPMQSQDGRYQIVFNGEIYNHEELKSTYLINTTLHGHSDTEVLIELISSKGILSALSLIKGMFAIALYDTETQSLYLARDTKGEKPLYYHQSNSNLSFSSELTPLQSGSVFPRELNSQSLYEYLNFGYSRGPKSIYRGIDRVLPGQIIEFALDDENSWQTISQRSFSYRHREVEDLSIDAFEKLLFKAVGGQLKSDVPIGAFLSGGVDSSLIAAVAQKLNDKPIDTFTISFTGSDYDESKYAAEVAKYIGANHHIIPVSEDEIKEEVIRVLESLDEPFSNASVIPYSLMCKKVRENITVCLAGDGGDELLAGYNRYKHGHELHRLNSIFPQKIRNTTASLIGSLVNKGFEEDSNAIQSLLKSRFGVNIPGKLQKVARGLKCQSAEELYFELISTGPGQKVLGRNINYSFDDFSISQSFLECAMNWDFNNYLPFESLFKGDRASMMNGLEVRTPLLDEEIVYFSKRYANSNKTILLKTPKLLLKQVLYRYVPRELIERPKMGFSVPIEKWLKGDLRDMVDTYLCGDLLQECTILDKDAVTTIYKNHYTGRKNHSLEIWNIFSFLIWYQKQTLLRSIA